MCDGQVRSSGDEKTREKRLYLYFEAEEGYDQGAPTAKIRPVNPAGRVVG